MVTLFLHAQYYCHQSIAYSSADGTCDACYEKRVTRQSKKGNTFLIYLLLNSLASNGTSWIYASYSAGLDLMRGWRKEDRILVRIAAANIFLLQWGIEEKQSHAWGPKVHGSGTSFASLVQSAQWQITPS